MKKDNTDKYDFSNIALQSIDFVGLYKTYYQPLCRFAKKIVDQDDEVDDIVSDFFVTLWEKRDTIHIKEKLSSYLYQSIRNICVNYLKHIKVKRKHSELTLSMLDNDDWLSTYDKDDPLSLMILQEIEREIEKAILGLPDQCRMIFEMWSEESEYQEIAEKLNTSLNVVRVQINHARRRLRNSIDIINKKK